MTALRPIFSETTQNIYNGLSSKSLVYHSRHQIKTVTNSEPLSPLPLFCDNMWPGSLVLADYLCSHPQFVTGKVCLELGAAIALPSMVASVLYAHSLVITDYPSHLVLENIEILFKKNELSFSNVSIAPHIWGQNIDLITQLSSKQNGKFDIIFLAELLWKDTYCQHENLLRSIAGFLDTDGVALVSFAHRPTESHSKEHDLEFLQLARRRFHLEYELLEMNEKYNDVDETISTQVFLYKLYYPPSITR